MKEKAKAFARKLANRRAWAYGLFWSWNIIFLAFMFLGFGPQILPEMMTAVQSGTIPTSFLDYAVVLTAIPAVMVILGLTILRRSPGKLFTLGYGVEGPLMLLVGIRFFVVRDATPAITLLLTIAGLGMAAFLWQIIDRSIDARGSWLAHLRVIGLTFLLIAGLYTGIWIAFYAVPIAVEGGRGIAYILRNLPEFLSDLWRALADAEWQWIPFMILGAVLGIYTATLFVGTPIAVPLLCIRAWRDGARVLNARHGRSRAMMFTLAVLIACAVLFVWTNRQPQHQAFAMLEEPPATIDDAQALLGRQETIRAGLLNSYLAPVRYISAVGEVRHVSDIYKSSLNMSSEQAARVQQLYETVARPLLYTPVNAPETDVWALRAEPVEASELYETFFDQPIVKGEHETIVRAVRSTWSIDQAMTGWLAVDDREVHLEHQEITVTENGDWAEVELYEVYRNQTGQRHEVVYYFSLPESAVITGVWLGNSADRDARFAYRVAPRGAAQAIYRNEVRRNVDPALVEQIGPRQYRLRIFPVEPQNLRWDDSRDRTLVEDSPPLHMWLTWHVLAANDAWVLPRLAEKRNVYWDDASTRLVNGKAMAAGEDDWLPESVPAASPVEMLEHRVDFPGGESVLIRPASSDDLPALPDGLQIALVLDRSRSMAERAAEVEAALEALAETADSDTAIDVYLTASAYRGEGPSRVGLAALEPDSIVYYGGQNAAELLAQFDALHAGQSYDVILVLTDDSGYDLGEGDVEVPIPDAPTWMVHLGGDFPLGYDDATLEAIQASGGGVVGGVEDALARLAVALGSAGGGSSYDVIDGYVWATVPTEIAGGQADDAFAPLAARQFILSTMQRQRDEMDRLETLDGLHAIAVEHSVVTPYSSMIVLVTDRQERLLDELETHGDRFEREHEDVGETVPATVTGVPEPEEWLLIALAALMLIWYARTSQLTPRRQRIG
ncbi:MAG: TIGR02921 family PEP-CTERM protein [Chloroflexi bacterium]|nr:TIGR02921 family PEP-CTERM protein [Chloroflexota bacterium]